MIYSVSQVNAYLKGLISDDILLSSLEIKGELSNVRYNPSGHIYFTVKDGKSAISGVMFASNAVSMTFRLTDGAAVVVNGEIGVYERAGTYQIYAKKIRREGSGELYEKYLKLKAELEEMGMFAEEYKQAVPPYISRLGIVTAPSGAAVHDIINISRRRDPYIEIILFPAKVQGEGAAESVAAGIRALDRYGVDTIIVGRGGGSIEDLWAFNEEIVARAIFECTTPVISAVGHETDTTIADYAADLRAPTPSAAAELAVFDYNEFIEKCEYYRETMRQYMTSGITFARQKAENAGLRLKRLSPENVLHDRQMRLDRIISDLNDGIGRNTDRKRIRLAVTSERLKGLSPLDKMNQGYSFVEDAESRPVSDAGSLHTGDTLKIIMKNGRVYADVRKIEKN